MSLINHLSFLHQPLSLRSKQSISFLQEALLKGVLINLSGTERTQVSLKPFVKVKADNLSLQPCESGNLTAAKAPLR